MGQFDTMFGMGGSGASAVPPPAVAGGGGEGGAVSAAERMAAAQAEMEAYQLQMAGGGALPNVRLLTPRVRWSTPPDKLPDHYHSQPVCLTELRPVGRNRRVMSGLEPWACWARHGWRRPVPRPRLRKWPTEGSAT